MIERPKDAVLKVVRGPLTGTGTSAPVLDPGSRMLVKSSVDFKMFNACIRLCNQAPTPLLLPHRPQQLHQLSPSSSSRTSDALLPEGPRSLYLLPRGRLLLKEAF